MIEILPIEYTSPYFKVVVHYMIGDADGDTEEVLYYSREDLEEHLPLILALNKLQPIKGYYGICFDNLPEEYPGSYIGVSEEEYALIIRAIEDDEYSLDSCRNPLYSERESYFVVFEGITVTYIDENNAEHQVKLS